MSVASLLKSGNPYYPTLTGATIGKLDVKTLTAATVAATTSVTAPAIIGTATVTAPAVTGTASVTSPAVTATDTLTLPVGPGPSTGALVISGSCNDFSSMQTYIVDGGGAIKQENVGLLHLRRIGTWAHFSFTQDQKVINNADDSQNIILFNDRLAEGFWPSETVQYACLVHVDTDSYVSAVFRIQVDGVLSIVSSVPWTSGLACGLASTISVCYPYFPP